MARTKGLVNFEHCSWQERQLARMNLAEVMARPGRRKQWATLQGAPSGCTLLPHCPALWRLPPSGKRTTQLRPRARLAGGSRNRR